MGRIFPKTRYTKATLGYTLLEEAHKLFGGPHIFTNSKVIHSTACYINNDDHMFTINIQEGAPFCQKDLWMLQFLRTYADCIVTTGKILRSEPACFDPRVPMSLGFD